MDKEEARDFLTSLLNKNLRILATDGRMFLGIFKCTDPDRNVVLAHTYEYRQPSAQQRAEAAKNAAAGTGSVSMDMTSRYLGLVVVPGQYIAKIEVEEFSSQLRGHNPYAEAAIV
ncbi:N-alpha-acetyltransferase 38-B, NatC auxiliary subunit [Colletotrichum siamense]|uniref:N-alpha-acetyltransferase 38-B, NatC auxiliary subunit n=1 Tax=Colletotrichum siamense TaxID=690259 RepID=A0A9P5K1W0_COLSI|nr:N-alpha-acetyltransferase 38-B, NatC auxiliary subunit [Colletotrichum siamense]KAF4819179.1 N-alpha-acetyltransferase 38-B, NatC auxiliary subunit [Colletotrichum siamense]KAF4839478.1 N-alpha-acetyltransferase 38-B, NatC auxiliary subunit [Colletotrichum siamense]KAF4853130.1 N-alpha-acetyltransferase 38-B, NatC auxiliary subunit [Colletotrichum siamense]KAF4878632.1 N-alpha-acetyltransferase 38-B, NatC auxiliary subunit [Colletotrichum siamense]KAF5492311.1 N-alpha-acetyltransferase 38-B